MAVTFFEGIWQRLGGEDCDTTENFGAMYAAFGCLRPTQRSEASVSRGNCSACVVTNRGLRDQRRREANLGFCQTVCQRALQLQHGALSMKNYYTSDPLWNSAREELVCFLGLMYFCRVRGGSPGVQLLLLLMPAVCVGHWRQQKGCPARTCSGTNPLQAEPWCLRP